MRVFVCVRVRTCLFCADNELNKYIQYLCGFAFVATRIQYVFYYCKQFVRILESRWIVNTALRLINWLRPGSWTSFMLIDCDLVIRIDCDVTCTSYVPFTCRSMLQNAAVLLPVVLHGSAGDDAAVRQSAQSAVADVRRHRRRLGRLLRVRRPANDGLHGPAGCQRVRGVSAVGRRRRCRRRRHGLGRLHRCSGRLHVRHPAAHESLHSPLPAPADPGGSPAVTGARRRFPDRVSCSRTYDIRILNMGNLRPLEGSCSSFPRWREISRDFAKSRANADGRPAHRNEAVRLELSIIRPSRISRAHALLDAPDTRAADIYTIFCNIYRNIVMHTTHTASRDVLITRSEPGMRGTADAVKMAGI